MDRNSIYSSRWSIDPPDAPIITYDRKTYTLTDNITTSADGIVIERDDIILMERATRFKGQQLGVE